MKTFSLILICFLFCQYSHADNTTLRLQIIELAKQQQAEIATLQANLEDSRNTAAGLYTNLGEAQTQVKQVAKEKEQWKSFGNQEHEKVMASAVTIQKQKAKLLRLYILIGIMSLLVVAYIGLRLHPATRLFIP